MFNHRLNCGNWGEALDTIKMNNDVEMKRSTLTDFINKMIKAEQQFEMIRLHYAQLEPQVHHFPVFDIASFSSKIFLFRWLELKASI